MRRGDFEAAWQISDAILRSRLNARCDHLPLEQQWLWRGQPLEEKSILIRTYHGLGDTIQFIRYAGLVHGIAKHVTVCAQPELLSLLQNLEGIDELFPLKDRELRIDYDVPVELMELPHIFRTTLETIPASIPYICVEPAEIVRDGNLQVGLVWEAGGWDPRRSIPLRSLDRLRELRGITFHILQRGKGLETCPKAFGRMTGSDDVFQAARVIAALDLLISVDSMPAHLAGALGIPTWTLLPAECDWRWLTDRHDSPWYPTMRLFRQPRSGDWHSVAERIYQELRDFSGVENRLEPAL